MRFKDLSLPLDQILFSIESSIYFTLRGYPESFLKEYPDVVNDLNRELEPLENELYLAKSWQLAEEKRRLLTCIIEQMSVIVFKGSDNGVMLSEAFYEWLPTLVELQKLINAANSMEELEIISESLIKFKQDLPEFE